MIEGGRLEFRTEHSVLDEEFCSINPGSVPGQYALLTIRDNGHGMDEETLKHIFEPFFTTKDKTEGTGLGLAMVYGIVKKHGGYITCSSELTKGTEFKIYFPILEGVGIMDKQGEKMNKGKGGNETILFVDDDKTNRELGEEILTSFGYKVMKAPDGESALQSYEDNKEKIDLVLLDLIMPGIDGQKCLEELIKMDPTVKVIVSSGYSSSNLPEEAIKYGARDFIGKPYNIKQMLSVVRKVLD
jgi:CheY-like chemotaxis protein